MLKIYISLCVILTSSLFASEVLIVAKSQKAFLASPDASKTWKVGDALCAKGSIGIGGCGKIVKITPKGYFVSVTYKKGEISNGMVVLKTSRLPASTGSEESFKSKPNRIVELSGGTEFSLYYLIPFVKAEYKLIDHVGIGVEPFIFMGSGSGLDYKAFGLGISASYYEKASLKGFFGTFSFGPNYYLLSAGTYSDSELTVGASLSAGYLYKINPQLSLIGSLGAKYLPLPEVMDRLFDYSSLQPYGSLSVGYLF